MDINKDNKTIRNYLPIFVVLTVTGLVILIIYGDIKVFLTYLGAVFCSIIWLVFHKYYISIKKARKGYKPYKFLLFHALINKAPLFHDEPCLPISKLTLVYDSSIENDPLFKKILNKLEKDFNTKNSQDHDLFSSIDLKKTSQNLRKKFLNAYKVDETSPVTEKEIYQTLTSSDVILVFRSLYLETHPFAYHLIEKWCIAHPDFPCIFIDSDSMLKNPPIPPHQIPLKYNFLKLNNVDDLPYAIIERATKRASDWHKLSTSNWSLWIVISILFFASLIFFDLNFLSAKKNNQSNYEIVSLYYDLQARNIRDQILLRNNIPLKAEEDLVVLLYALRTNCDQDFLYAIGSSKRKKPTNCDVWPVLAKCIISGAYLNKDMKVVFHYSSSHNNENPAFFFKRPTESLGDYILRSDSTKGDSIVLFFNKMKLTSRDTVYFSNHASSIYKQILGYYDEVKQIGITIESDIKNDNLLISDTTSTVIEEGFGRLPLFEINNNDLVPNNWTQICAESFSSRGVAIPEKCDACLKKKLNVPH